jgi:hypothetical protein
MGHRAKKWLLGPALAFMLPAAALPAAHDASTTQSVEHLDRAAFRDKVSPHGPNAPGLFRLIHLGPFSRAPDYLH